MPTLGATFHRVEGRTFEVQGRQVGLDDDWADDLPDTTHVAVEVPLVPGSYRVTVFDDNGRTIEESDCRCFSTDCSVSGIGCALTCFIFPLNLTCPRCLYCFLFG